jgi:hypothetical protein
MLNNIPLSVLEAHISKRRKEKERPIEGDEARTAHMILRNKSKHKSAKGI